MKINKFICLDPPLIETSKNTLYTGSGHDFTISCHVEANPKAEVIWIRNNRQIIRKESRIHTWEEKGSHYLSLKNVTKHDFGEYICDASNNNGIQRKNIIVVGKNSILCKKYIIFLFLRITKSSDNN